MGGKDKKARADSHEAEMSGGSGDSEKVRKKEARKAEKSAERKKAKADKAAIADPLALEPAGRAERKRARPKKPAGQDLVAPGRKAAKVSAQRDLGPAAMVSSAIESLAALAGADALAAKAKSVAGGVRRELETLGDQVLRRVQTLLAGLEERQRLLQREVAHIAGQMVGQFRRGLQSQMGTLQRRVGDLERRAARLERALSANGRRGT